MGGLKDESRTCRVLRGRDDAGGEDVGIVCRTRKVEGEEGNEEREVRKRGRREEVVDCILWTVDRRNLSTVFLI